MVIPETMLAVRHAGPGKPLALERMPVPAARPGEVLVRVRAAGVCRTELHFLDGLLDLGVTPLTLGHEIAGEVVALGPGAEGVRPGDRVLVCYYATCGRCRWCRTARENLCGRPVAQLGFTADGGYAEYVRAPARVMIPLPEALDFIPACTLGCSVTTALHASGTIANLQAGETAVVYGAGGVGFALVQVCKARGASVIAVGRSPRKLDRARALGADATVNAAEGKVAERIRTLTGGEGADAVFELVGTRETMAEAAAALRKRGRLVFIGYSADPFTVHPLRLVIDEAQILASVGNTLQEAHEAVAWAAAGRVQAIVDRTYPLSEAAAALEALRRGEIVGRAVLLP
ncbi:MAG TPA: zinc-binding dehydrogenase [Candidatus Sulfotelmatobacter sp.]|nr:zinc-binding dehydrogenase [Candidatus Sulfotelmatobacter sp.]